MAGLSLSQINPQKAPTTGGLSLSQIVGSQQPQPLSQKLWSSIAAPIATQAQAGRSMIQSGLNVGNTATNPGQLLQGGLDVINGLGNILASPIAPLLQPVGAGIQYVGDKLAETKPLQEFGAGMADVPATKLSFAEKITKGVMDTANALGVVAGLKQAPAAAKSAEKAYSSTATGVKNALKTTQESLDSSIVDNFTSAIKPTVAGKKTSAQLDKYNANVVSAVKSISQNKDALSFTDDLGDTITGRTPQTPAEFANAIDQTKSSIFKQYDALATKAGEKGAVVSTDPIHSELAAVAQNEALRTVNPGAIRYAQEWQNRLLNPDGTAKTFSTQTTQEIIKQLNSSLDAFYKNPTYDSASHAAIDASIARYFREGLDSVIENAKNIDDPSYAALKGQYAALKAIEKDVAHRSLVLARQQGAVGAAGLGKYVDIFSGGDMVSGLLTLNPALFARGVAQSALTRFVQYMNSPERAIQEMFRAAEMELK